MTRLIGRRLLVGALLILATGCSTPADPVAGSDDRAETSSSHTTLTPTSTSRSSSAGPSSAAPSDSAPSATTTTGTTLTPEDGAAGIPAPFELPAGSTATQVVSVDAVAPGATDVSVTAWERAANGSWIAVIGPVVGVVGEAGIGQTSEGSTLTPAGTFPLTEAFGIEPTPATALPYQQLDASDWWVSDVTSPLYNTFQSCPPDGCPFDTSSSEHLIDITPEYRYAVVIDYNRSPVIPGAGSAFFLHVSKFTPTLGCVAVDETTLIAILGWLDPAQDPVITITAN